LSRPQEGEAFATAKGQNAGYYSNAQNSYTAANADVSDFSDQLAQYKSSNPYVNGGAFQTATNQQLSNTADAAARSAGSRLQGQTERTGGNTAGAVAATEQMQDQNTRDLSSEEAAETQKRIGAGAQYNEGVLNATAKPEEMQASLTGQQLGAAGSALGTEAKAGETPGWEDEFGNAFATSLGKTFGSGGGGSQG
jgi:hypothetical protein